MPRINKEYREEAKRKIIAAALEVAVKDGWEKVTLDAIAQIVGVTKGAFYSYFPSSNILMQDVVIGMIRTIRDQMLEDLSDNLDNQRTIDCVADFIFVKVKPLFPAFIQAMASEIPKDPLFREKLLGLLDENHLRIVAVLSKYQETGQLSKGLDLSSAVLSIYGMSIGLGMMTHVLGKDVTLIKKIWTDAVRKILEINP
jgi:AcrR family transcriptional regulator